MADDGIVVTNRVRTMKEILDRLDKLDGRFDRIDGRLAGIECRLEVIDGRLEGVDRRFDAVDVRFDAVDVRFDGVDGRFGGIDGRLDAMDLQLRKQGVLLEAIGADLKQTMEGVVGNRQVMDREFAALRTQIDERVQPLEWARRHKSKHLAGPVAVKRRRKTR